jgi:hypothetical protein
MQPVQIQRCMSTERPLVLDLLNHIEQVEKLKVKPTFNVPTDFFSANQQDLKGLPEAQFDLQDDMRSRSVQQYVIRPA